MKFSLHYWLQKHKVTRQSLPWGLTNTLEVLEGIDKSLVSKQLRPYQRNNTCIHITCADRSWLPNRSLSLWSGCHGQVLNATETSTESVIVCAGGKGEGKKRKRCNWLLPYIFLLLVVPLKREDTVLFTFCSNSGFACLSPWGRSIVRVSHMASPNPCPLQCDCAATPVRWWSLFICSTPTLNLGSPLDSLLANRMWQK